MANSHKLHAFHDETQFQAGDSYKGHIIYFVPESLTLRSFTPMFGDHELFYSPIKEFRNKIETLRRSSTENHKLHFTSLSGRRWYQRDSLTRLVIEHAVDSLRSKRPRYFPNPLCCKMAILFFSAHTDISLYGGEVRKEKRLRHHETVLRMLLKGALHYLYTDEDEVEVNSLISDGTPFHRKLSDGRIFWQIKYDEYKGRTPLNPNIKFSENATIDQIDSDHKEHPQISENWIHANMLQVSDLLLGSTIRSCHIGCKDYPRLPKPGAEIDEKKDIVAYPVKRMLLKEKRGYGFQFSGHNRSFTVSYIKFENGGISFKPVKPLEIIKDNGYLELPFPD